MAALAARRLRNLAATLLLLSGCTHIAQLWFVQLDGIALLGALLGVIYLLTSLGLAGRSRFSLWVAAILPLLGAAAGVTVLDKGEPAYLMYWHLAADVTAAVLSGSILVRTRFVEMD
jgi:hypothetical protein